MSSFVAAGGRGAAGARTDQIGAVKRDSQEVGSCVDCKG